MIANSRLIERDGSKGGEEVLYLFLQLNDGRRRTEEESQTFIHNSAGKRYKNSVSIVYQVPMISHYFIYLFVVIPSKNASLGVEAIKDVCMYDFRLTANVVVSTTQFELQFCNIQAPMKI